MAMIERDIDRRLATLRRDHDEGKPVLDELRQLSRVVLGHADQAPLSAEEKHKVDVIRARLTVGPLSEAGDDPHLRRLADEFSRRIVGPGVVREVMSQLEQAVAEIRREQAEAVRLDAEATLAEARGQVAERYQRLLDRLVSSKGRVQG